MKNLAFWIILAKFKAFRARLGASAAPKMAPGAALHGVQTLKPRLPDCDGGDSSRGSSYLRDIMEEGTEAHPRPVFLSMSLGLCRG